MTSLMRDKRFLQHHDGLSVLEADELPYFEFIEYKKLLVEDLKQKNEQSEKQSSQFDKHKTSFNRRIPQPRIPNYKKR